MLGMIGGRRRRGRQRMRCLEGITNSMHMSLSKLQEMVKDREALCAAVQRVRHNQVTEQQHHHQSYYIPSSLYVPRVVHLYQTLLFSRNEAGFMMSLILQRRKLRQRIKYFAQGDQCVGRRSCDLNLSGPAPP